MSAKTLEARASEEPPQEAAGEYTVQIGSFGTANEAKRLFDRLITQGYPAYISEVAIKGKTWYRVRCGWFVTKEEADALRQLLADTGGLNGYVSRVAKPVAPPQRAEKHMKKRSQKGYGPKNERARTLYENTAEKQQTESNDPSNWFLNKGDVVVFYGDSITKEKTYCQIVAAGYRAASQKHDLEDDVRFSVLGYERKTAEWGLQQLGEVLAMKPTVVTLMWGMQDAYRQKYSKTQRLYEYRKAMTAQVRALQKAQIRPVILTIAPVDEKRNRNYSNRVLDSFAQVQLEVALETRAWLVDTRNALKLEAARVSQLVQGDGFGYLINDDGQLNLVGHGIIAESILDAWHIPR